MNADLANIYLIRHGETAWSLTGQHTGLIDLPLTAKGEAKATSLGRRLQQISFSQVFCSPLIRARRTCELAGYGDFAQINPDLVEWNYGQYEGKRTDEIRALQPGWNLFRDGCPGGESVADVAARADRVVEELRRNGAANILLFSSGHILRVIAARWLGLEARAGELLALDTASISVLGYGHQLDEPMIRSWNDLNHCNK